MKLEIYSTQSCIYCKKAKEYFKENNIAYDEYDVGKNPAYAQEMVKKSGQMGVPVIIAGGEVIVGFNKARLDQILKLA